MASQIPARPAWLHFSQVPAQRESQQTPSVQKPLPHSPSAVQADPPTFRQAPPTQVKPPAHSLAWVQRLRQAPEVESQLKGAQLFVPASTQVPPPLQVSAAAATVADRQLAGAQTVPLV
jgi:hypothetical protein